jgi:tetratricopeptide (TPR) repeat protein
MSSERVDDGLSSSALRRLVHVARSRQRLPKLSVTADSIFDAYQARRGRRRERVRQVALGLAVFLSVGYLGVAVDRAVERSGEASLDLASYTAAADQITREVAVTEELAPLAALAPRLERGAEVELLEPYARAPEILGPRSLRLGQGTYRVAFADGAGHRGLSVQTPAGELDLRAGVMTVAVAGDRVDVVVERGSAAWVRADELVPIAEPTAPALAEEELAEDEGPSAGELAELAEKSLSRGRRPAAIRHLRRLVSTYPRSTEAGRGLLDLGRLQRAEGDVDAARCAYQLYLDRYPKGALVAEVERALTRLGDGPQCRGLRARR